jgi:general secretion pathway protein A
MVLDFYELREHPFGVTPDSAYLFLSETHRETLASLLYGVDAGCGFVAFTAKPDTTKRMLPFHALKFLKVKVHNRVPLSGIMCVPELL